MRKYFIFIALVMAFVPAKAQAQPQDVGQYKGEIWNPTKVDWWVSLNDSPLNGAQNCEVHWLYDDSYDVLLTLGESNRLLFTFQISPKNKEIKPTLNLKQGMAKEATLIIDNVKHPLGVADVNLPPVMVIMGIPSLLNDVSFLKCAERILLKIDNTVHNFPLENIVENMDYFQKCVNTLNNGEIIKPSEPQETELNLSSPEFQTGDAIPYNSAVEIESLSSAPPPSFASPNEAAIPTENNLPEASQIGKQADNILEDLQYEGVKEKTSNKNKQQDESCPNISNAFDKQGTEIIQNLTRKLAILEKEKEELRTKLIGSSGHKSIVDILECGSQSLDTVDTAISDEIIAKFEITIENLRNENDLLKTALDEAEESKVTESENESEDLKKQIEELIKRNHELEGKLLEQQLKTDKKIEKEDVSEKDVSPEEKTDIIDKVIKENDLAEIIPKNPETFEKDILKELISEDSTTSPSLLE